MTVNRYRKKPVVIEAIQWTGENLDAVMAFCAGDATYTLMSKGNLELVISTLEDGSGFEAQHVASRGDWIIKGVKGEFYPCKPDIFAATYEPEDARVTPDPLSDPRVKALVEAATAMRDHLDMWQETGAVATAQESKALYDGIDAALRAIKEGGE